MERHTGEWGIAVPAVPLPSGHGHGTARRSSMNRRIERLWHLLLLALAAAAVTGFLSQAFA
jgi:hypothetical protein